jgi:hypothetical protein
MYYHGYVRQYDRATFWKATAEAKADKLNQIFEHVSHDCQLISAFQGI